MKIFTLIDCYLPGFKHGGPIRSLEGMVDQMPTECRFWIFTSDRDRGDTQPYAGIVADTWVQYGRAQVFYASPRRRTLRTLISKIREITPDVIYANSFFSRMTIRLLIALRLGLVREPAIVAPQGELSPGALALKGRKKRIFMRCATACGSLEQPAWRASTDVEAKDMTKALNLYRARPRVLIAPVIAPDLSSARVIEASSRRARKAAGVARFVFISRVSRMKNLHIAIELLRSLKGAVSLDIFGPKDDEKYWQQCEQSISTLPSSVRVQYQGVLLPEAVQSTFAGFDFFILPTISENFGHVILESLCARCPVILSDATPWRQLEASQAGWDIPLGQEDMWRRVLQRAVDMDDDEHRRMSDGAAALAKRRHDLVTDLGQNMSMFEQVIRSGRAPNAARGRY